jgi:hypothetical protein
MHHKNDRVSQICATEAKSQLTSGGFSPIRIISSLTSRSGGTGRLYGAGTPLKTRPARSYFEP